MNSKESVKELYKEREYLLGDKVNISHRLQ